MNQAPQYQVKQIKPRTSGGPSHRNADSPGRANCTFPLWNGQIEILNERTQKNWVKADAVVSMRMLPEPRVSIEVSNSPVILSGNVYNYGGLSTIRLLGGPGIEVRTLRVRMGESASSTLTPLKAPVTITKTGAHLASVKFDVLNYPGVFSPDSPAVLEEGPWRVEIRSHQDIGMTKEILNAEGGYGLTHEGVMSRLDGRSFPVEEAESILTEIHHFLSFARGGSCGLALATGYDKAENRAWEQWGCYSTYPWFALSSWLDQRRGNENEISQAFPGFARAMKRGQYGIQDRVIAALYWYLRSNESDNPYSGIILTQAALERLSFEIVSKNDLESALKKVGIGSNVPASCKALTATNRVNALKLLARVRNDLIHPFVKKKLSFDELLEIHNLGLWYTELLLLWTFGYRGRYANRIRYGYEGRFEPEVVPWSS